MADRAHSTSRRALLAGLSITPAIAKPMAAFALSTATGAGAVLGTHKALAAASEPSDLVRACDWASEHWRSYNARAKAEGWNNDRCEAETDRYVAVCRRAAVEPSASLAELQAKARLCLVDFEDRLNVFTIPDMNADPDFGEAMVLTVLREFLALDAAALGRAGR